MTKNFLQTKDKSLCCGCRACERICQHNAIEMQADYEGFIFPKIHKDLCVDCGLCSKVCPVSAVDNDKKIESIFAIQNKSKVSLKKSSSGGAFIGLAKYVLDKKGVVFGCVLKNNKAVIVSTENMKDLEEMQGSKYVSSDTLNTYPEVQSLLKQKRLVLYTGTPCQVAGLKKYLGKDYFNLITMDFLCHGVPSNKMFLANVNYLESKYNGSLDKYQFRDKSYKGWGHVTSYRINNIKHYEPGVTNAYFYGFINDLFNRLICYTCPFSGENRVSDFTVGDYWGYTGDAINPSHGVSFIAVNTLDKSDIIEKAFKDNYLVEQTKVDKVAVMNSTLVTKKQHNVSYLRKIVYKELNEKGFSNIRKLYLKPKNYLVIKYANKFWIRPKSIIKDFMRNK